MARFNGKNLVGAIGPVTFRNTKSGTVVSKRVRDVRQTVETKKSASFFGRVTSFASVLRHKMKFVGQQDPGSTNRLNKELLSIFLQSYNKAGQTYDFSKNYFSRLDGFELNTSSPLKDSLWQLPSIMLSQNQLTIEIPEMIIAESLKFPDCTTHCQVQIQIVQFDLHGGHHRDVTRLHYIVDRSEFVVPGQNFVIDVAPGTLCIVGLGLQYYKVAHGMNILFNTSMFSPAALVYAMFNEGVFSEKVIERTSTLLEDGSSMGQVFRYWYPCHSGFHIHQLPIVASPV